MKYILFYLLKILLVVGLFVIYSETGAQTPDRNFMKYQRYKKRLYNSFMIDADPLYYPPFGTYIPAHKRNPYKDFYNSGEIHWSDAGHTIGYFLAVMSTEYALENEIGLPDATLNHTLSEIVKILQAIERIDYMAEIRYGSRTCHVWEVDDTIIWPYPYPEGTLNGFFIRDDVGYRALVKDDISNFWRKNGQKMFVSTPQISSDYGKHDEMSQDQVWNLLQGLVLTQKLVNSSKLFVDGQGARVTVSHWAEKIALRILKYMQVSNELKIAFFNIPLRYWSILNPVTGKTVERGGKIIDLLPNAWLFGAAGNAIFDKKQGQMQFGFSPNITFNLPLPGFKHFNDHAKLALATLSGTQYASSFDSLLYWCHRCAREYNKGLSRDYQLFTYIHFPLMYLLLHAPEVAKTDYFYHYYLSYIEQRLNEAKMSGQWRSLFDINEDELRNKDDYPAPFWSAGKRLVKPTGKDYVLNPNDPATQPWEYNGLDYMLLYNLFELVRLKYFNQNVTFTGALPASLKHWKNAQKFWKKVDTTLFIMGQKKSPVSLNLYGKNIKFSGGSNNDFTVTLRPSGYAEKQTETFAPGNEGVTVRPYKLHYAPSGTHKFKKSKKELPYRLFNESERLILKSKDTTQTDQWRLKILNMERQPIIDHTVKRNITEIRFHNSGVKGPALMRIFIDGRVYYHRLYIKTQH